jgi:hypothetical protein
MRVRGQDSQGALSFGCRAAIAAEAADGFAEPGFELVDPAARLFSAEPRRLLPSMAAEALRSDDWRRDSLGTGG